MKTFDLIICNDHVLFDNGSGLVLLDTGSPLSFHESGTMQIGDEFVKVPTSFPQVNADYLCRNVGTEVRGLLGMDCIGGFRTLIDIPAKKIVFGAAMENFVEIPSFFFRIPGLILNVEGRVARVFLDTGAPVSYFSRKFTDGKIPCGRKEDFSPMLVSGRFETDIFSLNTIYSGESFKIKAGNLPPEMELLLQMSGVDGVVGIEILQKSGILFADGKIFIPDKFKESLENA